MAYPTVSGDRGSGPLQDSFGIDEAAVMGPDDGDIAATEVSISQKMLSAISGSIVTSLLVTPLDVVRVRLQAQSHPPTSSVPSRPLPADAASISRFSNLPPNLGISTCCREVFWINNNASYCVAGPTIAPTLPSSASCAADEVQSKTITSTFDGLKKIARNEGPRTLWRGLSPTLVMAAPANVIYFAGYDWLRTSPKSPFRGRISDAYAPLAAGSSARIMAAVAVGPLEMFRTRMQAATHATSPAGLFKETMTGMGDLVKAQGVRSLWTGLTLTLWRDVPFSAIYWWGYETCRNQITDARDRAEARGRSLEFSTGSGEERIRRRSRSRSNERHTATLVDSFTAGAASGAVAAFVTTPFDVGKTRQQVVRDTGANGSLNRPENKSMPRFLLHIFQEQGLSGLFRGWVPRVMKVAPACAIMISSYEVGKRMALSANELRDRRRNGNG